MSNVSQLQEHDTSHGPRKLHVTILASEWSSRKGGLSTINRELAIQLAKFSWVKVTFFLPNCSDKDKKAAASHSVFIRKAERLPGYRDELDWLSFPPDDLRIQVVVGHGVKLGHQAQFIRKSHKCKWIQIVHADPEELGIFKCYENPISTGEQKHHDVVELCQMADFVVSIGPKSTEAFCRYLSRYKKDVFEFTPGVLADFSSVQPETLVPVKRKLCRVLLFGRGDPKDFELKGFDIAARSIAALSNTHIYFVGAPYGKHLEIAKYFLGLGIPANCLKVRGYVDSQESLKGLFGEVDLVLMPSRTEGFGLPGLEALSAGLPVLVSKNSGLGEALASVPFGSLFVIDSEDPIAWTEAIKGIWNKDRKARLDEVKVVRCSYGKRYSWSEQCKPLIEKMFKLVDGTSSETEIAAQAVGARKRKLKEDLTGTSCEPEITEQRKGARKLKQNKDFTGTSFEPETVGARKLKRKKNFTGYRKFLQSFLRVKDVSSSPKTRTSCPSHVIEFIRQVYQKREGVILPVPWCERFSFQIEDIFTRLKLVEKEKTRGIVTSKEVTSMTSIFSPHEGCEQPLIVLIEGEPGTGKTTYCQKLVFDWARKLCREWDESFPRIDVLLFLRCRGIKSTLWDAIEDQILPADIKLEEKMMFFQFLEENPAKVLLVLDGLDEADPEKLGIFSKLIRRKQLPGSYIVLTSRHEAGSKVRPYTDTLLEIVGFTTADAEFYTRKYFQHEKPLAEELISKVKFDVDLRGLTHNPLFTLLLCVIFEHLDGVLPSNRTELYMEIVFLILRRYESKNGISRSEDPLLVYKKELMILGETALDSRRKQELYFDDHRGDIKKSLLIKFGFLSIQDNGSKRAPCARYGFFHKIFQEFFSGYYLAFSIIDDVSNSHSVLTDPRYMDNLFHVFKFMSGIVALRSVKTVVSVVQRIASIVNKTRELVSYLRVAHYFIEECKTCCLSTKLHCTLGESLELVDVAMRPSSLLYTNEVIGTFFKALNFNFTVRNLELLGWAFSAEATSQLVQTLRVNISLSSMNLGHNSIGDEGANSLAEALSVNTSLSSLILGHNSIGDEGANSLAQALRVNTSLSSLDLCVNSIGEEAANSLAQALRENTSLSSLNLSTNSIGDNGASSFAEALRVSTSLSSMDISSNYIDAEGAKSLAEALEVNTSLGLLNLSGNSIGDKGAKSLAKALRVNMSLSSLNLSCNYIDDEGASPLAQALKENSSLSSLNLSSNSIFDKAANLLAEALRVNTSLSSLDLSSNNIDADGAKSLAEALRKNTSLSSLDLSANSIGDKGANSLAEALRVNTSLSSLDLSSNFIDAEGATSLAHALRENTSLSSLGLSSNFIDAEGATLLAQALKGNTSLSCLGLSSNSIGAEGANSLTQALKLNTSLASLDLSCNSIGDEGARSLSEALKVNTSLSSLDLSFNSIGNKGAHSLAGALRENTSLSLNLSLNFIGTEGEISQSTALGLNCGLSVLE